MTVSFTIVTLTQSDWGKLLKTLRTVQVQKVKFTFL